MITSKHFHAVLERRRQFIISQGTQRYVRDYLPDRAELLKSRLNVLEFYDRHNPSVWHEVTLRFNQISFMATVWYVIKELEPYPTTRFCLLVDTPNSKGRINLSLQLSSEKYREEVTAVVNPEGFKLIGAAQSVQKFEMVLHWVCCTKLKSYMHDFVCGTELKGMAGNVQSNLVTRYKTDPIRFNLVSQCARLLMP